MDRVDEVFRDKAHSRFEYIQPDEALKKFQARYIDLDPDGENNTTLGLINFPDLDGTPLFIPRIVDENRDYLLEKLKGYGVPVTRDTLSTDEKNRLKYCLDRLKLPILLATHLTFNNPDSELGDYKIPPETSDPSWLVMVLGKAGLGKSTLVSTLVLKYSFESMSLDQFSPNTPEAYLNFFQESGLSQNSTEEEIIEAIREYREKAKGKGHQERARARTMRSLLDSYLEGYKKETKSGIILVEGVGSKGPGNMSVNIYHLVTRGGAEVEFSLTGQDTFDSHTLNNALLFFNRNKNVLQKEALGVRSRILRALHGGSS